jgi:hypothetical protein
MLLGLKLGRGALLLLTVNSVTFTITRNELKAVDGSSDQTARWNRGEDVHVLHWHSTLPFRPWAELHRI